ncbi:MAG: aromatic amino acid lyase, partial [Bacteroidota bacterium]
MSIPHQITGDRLDAGFFNSLLQDLSLNMPAGTRAVVQRSRDYLDSRIARTTEPIYGITTGFGSLYDRTIPKDHLEELQENLVTSHACGTGPQVPDEIVRLMLFLKIQSLSYGHSGVQPETIDMLMAMFNARAYPVVYEFGSLGASGDLAPLA